MFDLFRKRKIKKYTNEVILYLKENYEKPKEESKIRFEIKENYEEKDSGIRYSLRGSSDDLYNTREIENAMQNYSLSGDSYRALCGLEKAKNQTFVDKLLCYIEKKRLKDSEVYKAAQIDKRLFSKIVSNREYKPSKDTAIAFAIALKLSLDETNDILSRAGYTFSHSNERDIIIEYFFREKIYNLIDINEVLYNLNQKIIGRA